MTERLAHIHWLGGSPCSGKSTVAGRIAARFGHRIFDCDEAWFRHGETASPTLQPVLYRLARASGDELWLERTVEQQVRDAIASYHELFSKILADLAAMPTKSPIIAVGAALLPELVVAAGIPVDQALWMIPTETFQRHHYGQRAWRHDVLRATTDPDRAWENWMRRDAAFAKEVARQVTQIGGRLVTVDGSLGVDEIEQEVRDHFRLA